MNKPSYVFWYFSLNLYFRINNEIILEIEKSIENEIVIDLRLTKECWKNLFYWTNIDLCSWQKILYCGKYNEGEKKNWLQKWSNRKENKNVYDIRQL